MIRQPFKRRCAVCNRLNGLCESEDRRTRKAPIKVSQARPVTHRKVVLGMLKKVSQQSATGLSSPYRM